MILSLLRRHREKGEVGIVLTWTDLAFWQRVTVGAMWRWQLAQQEKCQCSFASCSFFRKNSKFQLTVLQIMKCWPIYSFIHYGPNTTCLLTRCKQWVPDCNWVTYVLLKIVHLKCFHLQSSVSALVFWEDKPSGFIKSRVKRGRPVRRLLQ